MLSQNSPSPEPEQFPASKEQTGTAPSEPSSDLAGGQMPESPQEGSSEQQKPGGKRLRKYKKEIRMLATALGFLAAGWGATQLLTDHSKKKEKKDDAPALVFKAPAVAVADDKFFARVGEKGDLKPVAFQFAEPGGFSYRFSAKTEGSPDVIVRGIQPGISNDELIGKLLKQKVEIKDGADQQKLDEAYRQQKIIGEKAEAVQQAEMFHSLRIVLAWGLVLGMTLVFLRKLAKMKSEGLKLSVFGSSTDGELLTSKPTEGFDHIGGIETVKAELESLKQDILNKQEGDPDIDLPKGVLLYGPPGTGKTMLARALAAETDCPFVSFKGSELSTQFFVGSGVARVREAFAQARALRDEQTRELAKQGSSKQGVCIVFIDEFDSLAQKREHALGRADKEETKVVNTLLAEMDNIDKERNRNIIVIAATNALEALDEAAIRPGRFNRRIEVPPPESKEARLDILGKAMKFQFSKKGFTVEEPSSLEKIARITPQKSGADLVGILEKASSLARRQGRKALTFDDLMEGFQQQSFGYKSSMNLPEEEKKKTAWHEVAGHGLVALACEVACYLISMEPRGKSLGRVITDPEAISEYAPTKAQLLKRLLINMAGQAAEEAKFGDLGRTTGAGQDMRDSRQILKILISTGLLGRRYAVDLLDQEQRAPQLKDRDERLIDAAVQAAQQTAMKIIKLVPESSLEALVQHSLELKDELVGDSALSFFQSLVPAEALQSMKDEVEKFLSDPLVGASLEEPAEMPV